LQAQVRRKCYSFNRGANLFSLADGLVRLYRNYDPSLEQGPIQLVSTFRALDDLIQVKRGSGLVLDWKQQGGNLLAGGDARCIRLWDAHTESQLVVRTLRTTEIRCDTNTNTGS
jgi:regulatory associated protein of mTOR